MYNQKIKSNIYHYLLQTPAPTGGLPCRIAFPGDTKGPCANALCRSGTTCFVNNNNTNEYVCKDPCLNVKCPCQGTWCYTIKSSCCPQSTSGQTCPRSCDYIGLCTTPCDAINCPPGTNCVLLKIGIVCGPNPPFIPCPRPNAICVATNSTSTTPVPTKPTKP